MDCNRMYWNGMGAEFAEAQRTVIGCGSLWSSGQTLHSCWPKRTALGEEESAEGAGPEWEELSLSFLRKWLHFLLPPVFSVYQQRECC